MAAAGHAYGMARAVVLTVTQINLTNTALHCVNYVKVFFLFTTLYLKISQNLRSL